MKKLLLLSVLLAPAVCSAQTKTLTDLIFAGQDILKQLSSQQVDQFKNSAMDVVSQAKNYIPALETTLQLTDLSDMPSSNLLNLLLGVYNAIKTNPDLASTLAKVTDSIETALQNANLTDLANYLKTTPMPLTQTQ